MLRAIISLMICRVSNSDSSLALASRFLIFWSRSRIFRCTASRPLLAVTPSKSVLRTVK